MNTRSSRSKLRKLSTRHRMVRFKQINRFIVIFLFQKVSFVDEELICLNTQKLYVEEKEALTKLIIKSEAELNELAEKSAQVLDLN